MSDVQPKSDAPATEPPKSTGLGGVQVLKYPIKVSESMEIRQLVWPDRLTGRQLVRYVIGDESIPAIVLMHVICDVCGIPDPAILTMDGDDLAEAMARVLRFFGLHGFLRR